LDLDEEEPRNFALQKFGAAAQSFNLVALPLHLTEPTLDLAIAAMLEEAIKQGGGGLVSLCPMFLKSLLDHWSQSSIWFSIFVRLTLILGLLIGRRTPDPKKLKKAGGCFLRTGHRTGM